MAARQDLPYKAEIVDVGAIGIVTDIPGHKLPPNAWTAGINIRFRNNSARRMEGDTQALITPAIVPYQLFSAAIADNSFWVYFNLTKAKVQNSGAESDITHAGGNYTTVNTRDWTGTVLAGIPIFNNNADKPQYWSKLDVTQVLQDLSNWPSSTTCKVMRSFSNYLIALNTTLSGTNSPHRVLVSAKSTPGALPASWDITDPTVDAVAFELTDAEGGEILDGVSLGSQFIVYKKNSTHTMRFIGGTDLWARDRLFETAGILNTHCACSFSDGTSHFVVTQNDVIVHQGYKSLKSVVEGVVRESLFASMDSTNYLNSFAFENPKFKECWFAYPETGNTYPNKALVYDYVKGTISFRDFNASSAALGIIQDTSQQAWNTDTGTWDANTTPWSSAGRQAVLYGSPGDGKIYQLDNGMSIRGTAPLRFLERTQLVYDGGKYLKFGSRVLIDRVWPKITGAGIWTIRVGASEYRDGPVTWSNTNTFNPATQTFFDVTPPISGRLPAIRFECQEAAASTIEGYDLRLAPLGEF